MKTKEVAIGVGGHSVIIKKISLPRMTQEELDESIQWEAEQYIPFDVKDVNIDTQIPDAGGGRRRADGRPAGRREEGHDQRLHLGLREAGLTATVVDVDAFAVQNAFEANYELDPARRWCSSTSARRSRTSTSSPAASTTFTRDITMGGNAFTEEIQKQLNVSYDEAEA